MSLYSRDPSERNRIQNNNNDLQAYTSVGYRAMYHKTNDSIGIATRGAKSKQIFSFGAGSNLGEARLRAVAETVMRELDNGKSPNDAKEWIDEQLDSDS